MCNARIFVAVGIFTSIFGACSKDYQVDPGEIEVPSSGQMSAEDLSSGEVRSSATNSSQVLPSSGSVLLSSGATLSSSTLVVNPETIPWIGNPPVQITEIDPNNLTWTDHLGSDPGWIEVYNPADAQVNLKGYSLVENLTTPRKWVFGEVVIPAKSYRTIFCSNLNLATPPTGAEDLGKNRAHTNWKLEGKGGTIYLVDSTLKLRDSLVYPSIPTGVSWGVLDSKWGFFSTITPEQPNVAPQFAKISGAVSFSTGGGFYTGVQSIAIPNSGGTIRCTQDGSLPTASSPLASGSIAISKTTVLRCASFEAGAVRGPVATQTYFIAEPSTAMPVVAISVDPIEMFDSIQGLYMPGPNARNHAGTEPDSGANFYSDRKVAVHVEYFGRDKKMKWHVDGGLSMMGNWSRMFPKKTVSIKFSENFGGSALNYPLFPSHPALTKFKAIVLRNGGNGFEMDFIRDALQCTSTEGLGVDYQKSDFVQVYFNGQYWGIHNLREKLNEDFVKTNYDIDAQTVDVVSVSGKGQKPIVEVSAGTATAYTELMAFLSSSSMSIEENYTKLKTMVDVGNYANYVGSEIYFRNTDWPGNNVKMWRTHTPAGPFKFMIYDTDHGFGFPYATGDRGPGYDLFNLMECKSGCPDWPNPPWATILFRRLMENPAWKALFINRMAVMLSHWYTPTRMNTLINNLNGMTNPEWKRDFDRWNDKSLVGPWYNDFQYSRNTTSFTSEINNMKSFADQRTDYVRGHMRSHYDLGDDAKVTLTANGPGKIQVHGFALPTASFEGQFFNGYAVEITAAPLTGATFTGWSDGVQTLTRTIVPGLIGSVSANFQ